MNMPESNHRRSRGARALHGHKKNIFRKNPQESADFNVTPNENFGLGSLPSRLQHAAVELFRGTMVSHSLIAYRDDRPDQNQPITFAGDRWRDYIPIVLPWTVRVRERLPPGSAAVLINQSHTFADLVLAIDAFEDRLLGAIDG